MTPIIGIPAALRLHWKRNWSKTRRTYLMPSSSMISQCVMTVVHRGGCLQSTAPIVSLLLKGGLTMSLPILLCVCCVGKMPARKLQHKRTRHINPRRALIRITRHMVLTGPLVRASQNAYVNPRIPWRRNVSLSQNRPR